MKRIIILSISVVAVSLALLNVASTDNPTYISVNERESSPSYSAKGAMEYLHRLTLILMFYSPKVRMAMPAAQKTEVPT